jgi:hypothetical protein
VTYLRGWTDAPDTDTGEAHAFVEGSLTALCGAEICADRGSPPWPPSVGRSCAECVTLIDSREP